jgi:hypothetical protein
VDPPPEAPRTAARSVRRWRSCILRARIFHARRNALSVDGWRPLYVASAAGADSVQPGLRETIEREVTMLEGAWPTGLPQA